MFPGATIAERVFEKARECRFFSVLMADYDRVGETEHFLFCLSAFLSAFRTTANRLYGVTEKQRGNDAKVALRNELHAHPLIGFLISKSNVEVHEDGVTVWRRYTVSVGDSTTGKLPGRWDRRSERWSSRFQPRYQRSAEAQVTAVGWQFKGNQSDLIALCLDALTEMENFIRQNISIVP